MSSLLKEQIRQMSVELWRSVPGNVLREDMPIKPEYAGTMLYDRPLIGFGAADDPLFDVFKKAEVVGPWHKSPKEWLSDSRTVISFFFPTSEDVLKSNRSMQQRGSELWAYARIEGQAFIEAYMNAVAQWFRDRGFSACVPSSDPRWQKVVAGQGISGYEEIRETTFGSSWSERHAAYVCGLGTFGLSKGLITERGMAGRFGSIIVSAALEADKRKYTGVYDYCIRCGACARRCPAKAIDLETGKDHKKCKDFIAASSKELAPRYGCGLCQTGVPCERQIPHPAYRSWCE